MANDKKFVVKNGLAAQNVSFVDDTQSVNNTITVSMLAGDTLSFSGDSGQLFSITDNLTGTIFAVNDISGVPSIEVDDDGTIRFAETFGNVLIGTATENGTDKLQVNGNISATNATITASTFKLGTTVSETTNSQTVATTSLTSIDTTSASAFRTVKYVVQITQGTSYQSSEVLITHNGTVTYMTEYAILRNGTNLGTLSSDISGGNIRLLVTMGSATSATIKLFKTAIEV